jgi:ribonuclease T2
VPGILRQVRRAFLASLVVLAALQLGDSASAEDSYLLALTWQPGFCAGQIHAAYAECRIVPKDKPRLVLHGLWPDWDANGDGKRDGGDAFCIPGADDRNAMMARDAGNWLKLPPVKLSPASSSDLQAAMPGTAAGLDRHEWWKHGTCSALEADAYFAIAIALLREVERGSLARLIVDYAGEEVERKKVLEAFELDFGPKSARALLLDCGEGGEELQEIRIRLKRGTVAQGLTAETLAIPASPARGNCGARIRIPTWQN